MSKLYEARHSVRSTQTKAFPLRWMAPESFLKSPPSFTPQTDVWSFGITMWEVLEETEPYQGVNETQVIRELIETPHVRL